MQLHRFRFSTNVDRVLLALAHKGMHVESVWVDPADRSPVEALSGQPLVPVLVDGDAVIADSPLIVEHLERRRPDPPLFPSDPAAAAEVRVFIDWFNRVWKVAPNAFADALDGPTPPTEEQRAGWIATMAAHQELFEGLLTGREHLFGAFGAADCIAWPFLRYGAWIEPDDVHTFHVTLNRHLPLARFPNLARWIDRVGAERWPAASRL